MTSFRIGRGSEGAMFDRRFARCGRAYLLWGLLGFVAVQLILGALIDQAWPDVRDPLYTTRLRQFRAMRAARPDAPLVVALGSSRTWFGLQTARMHPVVDGRPALVYNFARQGCGPTFQLLMLQRLLADGVRPQRVLVEIMPGFLNCHDGRLLDERGIDAALLRTDEVIRAAHYAKKPWTLARYWVLGRVLPCDRHGVELAQRLPLGDAAPATIDPANGWYPQHVSVTPEERASLTDFALGQYHHEFTRFRVAPQPVRALRDLLALCRRNGIQAALVVPPEGTAFRDLYDPAAFPAIDGVLADLRR